MEILNTQVLVALHLFFSPQIGRKYLIVSVISKGYKIYFEYFSLVTSLISICIFGWRWNEWMWLLKNFPWKKIEFWWSLVHIFLMIAAGLVSFIGLANLGNTTLKGEVIATGVFCFLGEFLDTGPCVYVCEFLK